MDKKEKENDIFDKYFFEMCSFAYFFTRNKLESVKIVTEVFECLYRKLNVVNKEKNIKAFLYIRIKSEALYFIQFRNKKVA